MNAIYSECDRSDLARIISLKCTNIYLHIKILLCSHVGIKCSRTEDKKNGKHIFSTYANIVNKYLRVTWVVRAGEYISYIMFNAYVCVRAHSRRRFKHYNIMLHCVRLKIGTLSFVHNIIDMVR